MMKTNPIRRRMVPALLGILLVAALLIGTGVLRAANDSGSDQSEPKAKPAAADAPCAEDEKVQWLTYEEALKQAKKLCRPVLLFFHRPNCRQCELLEKNGFDRPDIACYVNRKFAPASIDTRQRDDVRIKHRVTASPTVWFISEEGAPIDYFVGYMAPDRLKLILRYVGDGVYREKGFEEFEKQETDK